MLVNYILPGLSTFKCKYMKREIIKEMIKIAGPERAGDLSYDMKALEGYDGEFIWITYGEFYTRLIKCSGEFILKSLNESQSSKYYFARSGWKLDVPNYGEPRFYFYFRGNGYLIETSLQHVATESKMIYRSAVLEWKAQGNRFPTQLTIGSIRFMCEDSYVEEQLKYAEKHNDDSLKNIFENFKSRPRCNDLHEIVVSKDFAERSFIFTELIDGKPVLNGGIIFHGYPEEGYKDGRSVQLTKSYGWAVHT